jgi:hypothetical protein
MPQTLRGIDPDRLERSCNPRHDWIRFGASAPGVERAEVYLTTCAFEPHRPDTYTVSNTIGGNLICHGNTPPAQIGDAALEGGGANTVGGNAIGECADLTE